MLRVFLIWGAKGTNLDPFLFFFTQCSFGKEIPFNGQVLWTGNQIPPPVFVTSPLLCVLICKVKLKGTYLTVSSWALSELIHQCLVHRRSAITIINIIVHTSFNDVYPDNILEKTKFFANNVESDCIEILFEPNLVLSSKDTYEAITL